MPVFIRLLILSLLTFLLSGCPEEEIEEPCQVDCATSQYCGAKECDACPDQCAEPDPPAEDAGNTTPPTTDAGNTAPPTTDAGNTTPPTTDAGNTTPPITDAGNTAPPTTDAGVIEETDAGVTEETDAGVTETADAGTTPQLTPIEALEAACVVTGRPCDGSTYALRLYLDTQTFPSNNNGQEKFFLCDIPVENSSTCVGNRLDFYFVGETLPSSIDPSIIGQGGWRVDIASATLSYVPRPPLSDGLRLDGSLIDVTFINDSSDEAPNHITEL